MLNFLEDLVSELVEIKDNMNYFMEGMENIEHTQNDIVWQYDDLAWRVQDIQDKQWDMSMQLWDLADAQITMDFFYINEDAFEIPIGNGAQKCWDTMWANEGETFDFTANMSTATDAMEFDVRQVTMTLTKDMEEVANASYMASGDGWRAGQLTLNYRDRMERDSKFQLCIVPGQDFKGTEVGAGAFQYGYKTYGPAHWFECGQ